MAAVSTLNMQFCLHVQSEAEVSFLQCGSRILRYCCCWTLWEPVIVARGCSRRPKNWLVFLIPELIIMNNSCWSQLDFTSGTAAEVSSNQKVLVLMHLSQGRLNLGEYNAIKMYCRPRYLLSQYACTYVFTFCDAGIESRFHVSQASTLSRRPTVEITSLGFFLSLFTFFFLQTKVL